jgi:DNA-binding CsgD family transcriptional regulator
MKNNQEQFEARKAEPDDPSSRTSVLSAVFITMNLLNLGIVIVDHEFRIVFANEYATTLLRTLKRAGVQGVPPNSNYGIGPLGKRLRDAISSSSPDDDLLALTGAGRNSMIVRIVPYNDEPDNEGRSGSILFMCDVHFTSDLDLRPAATLYGLTRAESRLLEALLSGETISGYARNCGITLNTVKGHLSQLFRKTQTSRQSELVLRVLGNPVFRLVSPRSSFAQSEGPQL